MPDADHEAMGSLTVHTGTHPIMGEIVVVSSSTKDAVLIHGGVDSASWMTAFAGNADVSLN